jgi:hypothetical protein
MVRHCLSAETSSTSSMAIRVLFLLGNRDRFDSLTLILDAFDSLRVWACLPPRQSDGQRTSVACNSRRTGRRIASRRTGGSESSQNLGSCSQTISGCSEISRRRLTDLWSFGLSKSRKQLGIASIGGAIRFRVCQFGSKLRSGSENLLFDEKLVLADKNQEMAETRSRTLIHKVTSSTRYNIKQEERNCIVKLIGSTRLNGLSPCELALVLSLHRYEDL